ncbi:OmpA family protein, partial [Pseudomonas sp. TH10]|uniref:OmpA family protein n=1 Tax=Pseudomonas sp. TH10 TaxID=2796376 RepID=UPI001911CE19
SVSLDAANQKIIKGVVDEFDLRLHSCGNSKTPEQIVHHVNVLWHGLGERTLIELPFLTDSSSGSPYQVELNRSGVNLVRRPGNEAGIALCFSLGNDLLFDTYASTLTDEGTAALTAFATQVKTYLKDSKRLIIAISVTGHSDRNPVRAANDSNQKLSLRRAKSVAELLKTLSPELQLNIKAAGSHVPVSSCARDLPKAELSECLAMDRRVEIIVQTWAL